MNNSYWDYLEHHGIFGQKWGHRNGPPYPIEPNNHSAAEKKANPGLMAKAKAAISDSQTKKIKQQSKQIQRQREELKKLKTEKDKEKQNQKNDKKEEKRVEQLNKDRQKLSATQMYKKLDTLSDKEISDYLNRISNEKRIRDLAAQEYAADHPVKTFIKNTGKTVIKDVEKGLAAGAADYLGKKATKAINENLIKNPDFQFEFKGSNNKKAKKGPKLN